jgi:hypothetical protein
MRLDQLASAGGIGGSNEDIDIEDAGQTGLAVAVEMAGDSLIVQGIPDHLGLSGVF